MERNGDSSNANQRSINGDNPSPELARQRIQYNNTMRKYLQQEEHFHIDELARVRGRMLGLDMDTARLMPFRLDYDELADIIINGGGVRDLDEFRD